MELQKKYSNNTVPQRGQLLAYKALQESKTIQCLYLDFKKWVVFWSHVQLQIRSKTNLNYKTCIHHQKLRWNETSEPGVLGVRGESQSVVK